MSRFLSSTLTALPLALRILTTLVLLPLGALSLLLGHRSAAFGLSWGKQRGQSSSGYLPGGLGGLLQGFTAGAILATVIILLIVQLAGTSVNGAGFISATMLFGMVLAGLGGRFRFVGKLCAATAGSISIALILIATLRLHSLVSHLAILAVLLPLGMGLALWPRTEKVLIPLTSVSGAWLIILGISLWANAGSMFDLISLLVPCKNLDDEELWQTVRSGAGVGLIVGWWLMGLVGIGVQIYFKDPSVESSWNDYLGELIEERKVPLAATGVFSPLPTLFQRVFKSSSPKARFTDLPLVASRRSRRRSSRRMEQDPGRGYDSDEETLGWSVKGPAAYDDPFEGGSSDEGYSEDEAHRGIRRGKIGSGSISSGTTLFDRETELDPATDPTRGKESRARMQTQEEDYQTVPATPSLLYAIDRINLAKRAARSGATSPSSPALLHLVPLEARSKEEHQEIETSKQRLELMRDLVGDQKDEREEERKREGWRELWDEVEQVED